MLYDLFIAILANKQNRHVAFTPIEHNDLKKTVSYWFLLYFYFQTILFKKRFSFY